MFRACKQNQHLLHIGPFWRPTGKDDQYRLFAEESDKIKSSYSGNKFDQLVVMYPPHLIPNISDQ